MGFGEDVVGSLAENIVADEEVWRHGAFHKLWRDEHQDRRRRSDGASSSNSSSVML